MGGCEGAGEVGEDGGESAVMGRTQRMWDA